MNEDWKGKLNYLLITIIIFLLFNRSFLKDEQSVNEHFRSSA